MANVAPFKGNSYGEGGNSNGEITGFKDNSFSENFTSSFSLIYILLDVNHSFPGLLWFLPEILTKNKVLDMNCVWYES